MSSGREFILIQIYAMSIHTELKFVCDRSQNSKSQSLKIWFGRGGGSRGSGCTAAYPNCMICGIELLVIGKQTNQGC